MEFLGEEIYMPTSRKIQGSRKPLDRRRRAKEALSKKSKKSSKTRKISAREFEEKFTTIVAGHLSTLPPEEQDVRIRAAERVAAIRRRGVVSTT